MAQPFVPGQPQRRKQHSHSDPANGVHGSGNDLGGLDITGISGGTFAVDMVRVAGDGVIMSGISKALQILAEGRFIRTTVGRMRLRRQPSPTAAMRGSPCTLAMIWL